MSAGTYGVSLAADAAPPRHGLSYGGEAGPLAGIVLVNGLLTLVTLGVYRFWGNTRLRRYLWSRVALHDDPLEYTGRGLELFLGFLLVLLILGPLVAASLWLDLVLAGSPGVIQVKAAIEGLAIFFLIFFAIYRARRYRLSRTRWRGIRAGQTGSAMKYALLAFLTLILVGLTFGLAYPYYRMVLQRYALQNTWFGDQSFEFDGRARDLFWRWLLAMLLFLPTLGISYVWYQVAEFRYVASTTRYRSLTFRSELRTMQVLLIYLVLSAGRPARSSG